MHRRRGESPPPPPPRTPMPKAIGWIAVAALVLGGGMWFAQTWHPLFNEETATCQVTSPTQHHSVRRGPDRQTIETDCGTFNIRNPVICTADPSREVHLAMGTIYEVTFRGPRIPLLADPAIVAAEVTPEQPPMEPDPVATEWTAHLVEQFSRENLRAWDYEQPPYFPACDSWRMLMTSEGVQQISLPRAEFLMTVPEGVVPRDPLLPCEGYSCGRH